MHALQDVGTAMRCAVGNRWNSVKTGSGGSLKTIGNVRLYLVLVPEVPAGPVMRISPYLRARNLVLDRFHPFDFNILQSLLITC